MGPSVICHWRAGLPLLGFSHGQSEPLDAGPGLGSPVTLASVCFPISCVAGRALLYTFVCHFPAYLAQKMLGAGARA